MIFSRIKEGTSIHGPAFQHNMEVFSNWSLLIKNVNKDDAGRYKFVANYFRRRPEEGYVEFQVYYPVTKPSIQVNKTIGKDLVSVFLKCPTKDIDNSIHWFFKGQSLNITNRMRLTQKNRTLEIIPAKREDSGDYHCGVSNPLGSKRSDPIQLDIIEPVIKPSIQFTNTTVKDLTSVILKCLSNDTGISIHWLFKGHSLRITNRMKLSPNNSTLKIVPARSSHSGDYQCEVSNPVSFKRSDPIQVDIIDPVTPPSIQVTNTTVKNMISVFLTCLSNDTGVSIHWIFKGQSVNLTDRIHLSHNNSTLQIDSVRIEDSGYYQCEVSNPVSSKRSDPIQLDIIQEDKLKLSEDNRTLILLSVVRTDTGP
ncbi:carcinoembryonic antigen-related cell adhesion molecule 1-like [Peromyscus eremicus]|uniref:carcinoembryonic antigen-related cell adhesion molecule 1-like n=1 Tax=Peromyscus eremicus TaxID=42410 RepID=UPI0027DD04E2|nr:carcinoembryonic antigen-related cell adhesion molecule 1-like [Peromyscus eremicus]